jgi:hypothetical protein
VTHPDLESIVDALGIALTLGLIAETSNLASEVIEIDLCQAPTALIDTRHL